MILDYSEVINICQKYLLNSFTCLIDENRHKAVIAIAMGRWCKTHYRHVHSMIRYRTRRLFRKPDEGSDLEKGGFLSSVASRPGGRSRPIPEVKGSTDGSHCIGLMCPFIQTCFGKGTARGYYHGVAEEGVPFREIAVYLTIDH